MVLDIRNMVTFGEKVIMTGKGPKNECFCSADSILFLYLYSPLFFIFFPKILHCIVIENIQCCTWRKKTKFSGNSVNRLISLSPQGKTGIPGPDGLEGSWGLKGPQVHISTKQNVTTWRIWRFDGIHQTSLQNYRCLKCFQSNKVRKRHSLDLTSI